MRAAGADHYWPSNSASLEVLWLRSPPSPVLSVLPGQLAESDQPTDAHPFRPCASSSARRPRSFRPSGDDTGGAAALGPRALGTTGAAKPLFHHQNRCMLAHITGWSREARQAATEGLATTLRQAGGGMVSFWVGGNTDKTKKLPEVPRSLQEPPGALGIPSDS